jgi:dephospho-CoA kinase|tara:strand:+ start:1383 stop:1937 length:555 start_codon:yes stop_codon:yes gene_type:complete
MKIIAITGLPLAGKGIITQKLVEKGFKKVVMSDAVRAEMDKKGIQINHENLRNFATEIRDKHGRGYVAELCIPLINELKSEPSVVIDGIRSPEAIIIFKKEYGADFVLISVNSSFEIRYSRLGRPERTGDDPVSSEELKWRDEKELGWGLAETIEKADYLIENDGTMAEFEQKIKELLTKITTS